MLKGYFDLASGQWTAYLTLMIPLVLGSLVVIIGAEIHRYFERKGRLPDYPFIKYDVLTLVIAYREDLEIFRRCLESVRSSLELACNQFNIIVVIDGMRRHPEHSRKMAELAAQYAQYVFGTETGNKRNSIAKAMEEARRRNLPGDIVDLVDSDTIGADDQVAIELFKPFADPEVGGSMTAQYIFEPKTWAEQDSAQFEEARTNMSLRFLNLPGVQQVGCLPGRRIAIRRKIIEQCLYDFNNEYILGNRCVPGDDRFFTLACQKDPISSKTVTAFKAKVFTLAKETYPLTFLMWLRWARTFQRYTIQNLWLFRKKPFTAFIYWFEIYRTIAVTALVAMWIGSIWLGGSWQISVIQALIFSFMSMVLMMSLRQYRYLWDHPGAIWRQPRFVVVATLCKLVHFAGLLTMHKTGWLSRAGADDSKQSGDDSVWLLYENGKPVA